MSPQKKKEDREHLDKWLLKNRRVMSSLKIGKDRKKSRLRRKSD